LIHLHNHTEYSLLDGASRIKDLVQKARSFDMPAVAITDHANLYGAIEFYKACKSADIKPIIGCELYMAPNSRFTKNSPKRHHLVLLAESLEGYHNLIKIASQAYTEGFYYKPRADWDLLQQYSKGLTCLSACIAGEIPTLILNNNISEAEKRSGEFNELFENFYLELMDHGMPEEKKVNKELVRISKKLNIPLVATNDTHYINQSDAYIQDILLCIGTKNKISNPDRYKFPSNQFYFKSPEEMTAIFKEVPEAISNTYKIAESCNLDFNFDNHYIPKFFTDDSKALLKQKTYLNLFKRLPHRPPKVMERLNYELDTINNMGFADYFLIVHDIVNWCKQKNIPVGPGRGSAAGSLVSYVLGITELNPLDYDLLFERFLNPARISMPDIDLDFCYRRRDEVVNYITERYGKDRVAQIVTFGTMAAKAAIRDVGRVLDYPLPDIDHLAKKTSSLQGATDSQLQKVLDVASKIEDMPRHTGTHAAGVIIGAEPLTNIVPVQISDGAVTTQYDMSICEEIGLLKMDILGLKTLTVIDDALKLIKDKININRLPMNDPKVFNLLSHGNTVGIFQVESDGMQRILKKLKPNCFEDLIAMVALYRPGPLGSGMVDDFIDCKHGEKEIKYLHPVLESILKETYGVILYQEQVMKIATEMAGFTLAEADLMRRAVGKKKPEVLAAQRQKFIEGAKKKIISKEIADEVFNLIDYFSGYGFNKSHSAAYAFIAYQTAYLKTYYPKEFIAALLTNTTNQGKISVLLNECRRLNVKILPPDINKSGKAFTLDRGEIRFGLNAIKNLGDAVISQIIEHQPYKDVFDLKYKANLSKSTLETLISAGCLSQFGSRKTLITALPNIIQASSIIERNEVTLFGTGEELLPEIKDVGEFSLEDLLQFEKDLLGFYVSSHPLDKFSLPKHTEIANLSEGSHAVVGIVTKIKKGIKNNKEWTLVSVEDYTGTMNILFFNRPVKLLINQAYLFKGKVVAEEDGYKMFAYNYASLEQKAA